MRKFALILAALIVVGIVNSVEAANRLQIIRSAVPRVMNTAMKIGDDVAGFFWKNKVAITTGTLLVTAATNPEPFVEGAVAVVNGPPVVIQNTGDYPIAQKRVRSTDWSGYVVLGTLIGIGGLILMYEAGGRARTVAKIVTVALFVGFVLFCCGVVRADVPDANDTVICAVQPLGGAFWWNRLFDLLTIIILLFLPLA